MVEESEKYKVVFNVHGDDQENIVLEIECNDFDYVTEGDTFVHFLKDFLNEDETVTQHVVLSVPTSNLLYFQKV